MRPGRIGSSAADRASGRQARFLTGEVSCISAFLPFSDPYHNVLMCGLHYACQTCNTTRALDLDTTTLRGSSSARDEIVNLI